MKKLTAGAAVFDVLAGEGVTHLFGIAGDGNLELLDALARSNVRFVSARHEEGASYMAYGYARVRKGLGACLSMYGPGATNMLSGIGAAFKGNVPLIALTGKHSRSIHVHDGTQQLDEVAIYRPVTKWSIMASHAEEIPAIMRKACRVALAEPQGPVHVNLPVDLIDAEVEDLARPPEQYRFQGEPRVDAATVRATARRLADARAPVILAGPEVIREGATAALLRLAERLGVPVATTSGQMDAFPTTHPLGLGPFGGWAGWDPANELVKGADLILAVGVRFDYDLGAVRSPYSTLAVETPIIQVNRHPDTIGAIYPVALGAAGSLHAFLEDLLAEAERRHLPQRPTDLADLKASWAAKRSALADPEARPIRTEYAMSVIRAAMAEDGVLLTDVGNTLVRSRPYFDTYQPDTFVYVEGWGALGSAFPTSLGVQLALAGRQVICLAGDGAFIMGIAELDTAVREHLPVKVFIGNDATYGSVWNRQKRFHGGRFVGSEFRQLNFANIAREFGAFGEKVIDPNELPDAVRRALRHDGPAVVDIVTDRE